MARDGISPNFYKAFHVRLVDEHSFVDGFDSMDGADADASTRNDRAKKLNIKARYETVKNPGNVNAG